MRLESSHIILRDWEANDLAPFRYWLKPYHKWQELDGPYYPDTAPEEINEMIENIQKHIEVNDWKTPRTRLVIADKTSNQFLGTVSWYWESQETNWLSVGIVIHDKKYWGQGLGYEALTLWCDYLFTTMPEIVRLDLRTWSGNTGMMKLAEKLGFTLEARFRKARIVNGEYFDGLGYGILREEWKAKP
jgi:RimJ/RimL family protein N-acetyltransferase